MVKYGIRTKLFLTYFVILLITFIISTVLFNVLSRQYLLKEARTQLRQEGLLIAAALEKIPFQEANIREVISARRELKVLGRYIESRIIVLNNERRVLFTNLEPGDRQVLADLTLQDVGKRKLRGFVVEKVPVKDNHGGMKAQVILLTYVKDIINISGLFRRTQLLSLLIAAFVALVMGGVFGKSLTNPLALLMTSMTKFSLRSPFEMVEIKTADEIEELAGCFNKMAEKLKDHDEKQKRFLQNTSHELKTPLMSIQGYAEAIKDRVVEGKEMEESLEIIIEESQRLKKVVEELIFLTKLENTDDIFNYSIQEIGELARKAVQSLQALADAKGIVIHLKGDLTYCGRFDGDKLKQAFINIVENSLRYARSLINIEISRKDTYLEIIVSDDGPGFKEGEAAQVFERFYKGDQGVTGLGLAITRAIITGHGGSIAAFNGLSKGAVFRITIPI
ncbi:MAG: ATP-binding protein [Peptococcaceae bacterium]